MSIKIRAWDKENGVMAYSDDNYPLSPYVIGFDFLNKNKLTLSVLVDINNHIMQKVNAVFMRNTGFTDVNNKDIYELDIVKVFNVATGEKFRGTVEYSNGYFYILDDSGTQYKRWGVYEVEVVGNIYTQDIF